MTALYIGYEVPICDPKTGIVNPIWYRLLSQVFRTIASGGVSNELAFEVSPMVDMGGIYALAADLDNVEPVTQQLYFSADDVLPVIAGLRDQIAILSAAVDDIRKGTVSL